MQVHVSAQHFSMGESLQQYINDKLVLHIKKYFDHVVRADVHFDKTNHLFRCEIVVHTGVKVVIVGDGSSEDVYTSFDICLTKIDKQLKKYKSKLKDYHQKMKMRQSIESKKYIISSNISEEIEESDPNLPTIIQEKDVSIMNLTVQEAVMKMDLENLPALMFTNLDNGRLNVVYYKKNGIIAWVDSK